MLIGTYYHNVDAKGRVFMPVKLREELGERFMATRGIGKCLFVLSMEEFDRIAEKIKEIPLSNLPAQRFMRDFFSNACECEPDKQGRILLPQNLRSHIGVIKEAVVTGVLNRVEIWSKEGYESYTGDSDNEYEQMLAQMSELGI